MTHMSIGDLQYNTVNKAHFGNLSVLGGVLFFSSKFFMMMEGKGECFSVIII